jgi:hypothetical protein
MMRCLPIAALLVLACRHEVPGSGFGAAKSASPPPKSCAAQVFQKSVPSCCGGTPGHRTFAWDGAACIDVTEKPGMCGCQCLGPDCNHLFETAAACEAAYRHCLSPTR